MSINPFQIDLSGKVAVITGGGGVLCSEIAKGLGEAGASVALLNRNKEKSAPVAQAIEEAGGKAIAISADVLSDESLEAALKEITDAFGGIDILINGAGGNQPGATASLERATEASVEGSDEGTSFFQLQMDSFSSVIDVNLLGTIRTCQIFGKAIHERGGGTILNISSMAAFKPLTKVAGYSASKAAVSNFTQWLAVHLAPLNIRVNAIAPGFFLTEQNRFLLTDEKTGELTTRGNTIISQTPMRKFGEPGDLLGITLCLVSDAGKFMTGTVIPIDGGFEAFSGV